MNLACLILAGGLGTRMSAFTQEMPKALIPVADRPFLHHQLDLLASQGFRRVVLAIGYRGEQIISELNAHPHPDLVIECVPDGNSLLGTGGAVRHIVDTCLFDEYFFITYGDSYLPVSPDSIQQQFQPDRYSALMTVYPNADQLDRNNAHLHADGHVSYHKNLENPEQHGLDMVDYGLCLVSRSSILDVIPANATSDLATYFQQLSESGRLQGVLVPDRFYEIGSPRGRDELERLLSHDVER